MVSYALKRKNVFKNTCSLVYLLLDTCMPSLLFYFVTIFISISRLISFSPSLRMSLQGDIVHLVYRNVLIAFAALRHLLPRCTNDVHLDNYRYNLQ